MKRILIAAVCLVALAAASMPYVNGMLMERGYRQLVDRVNEMYQEQGADIKVEIVRYERSYSTTEVEWKMKLGPYSEVYQVEEIIILDRGKHGIHKAVFSSSLEKNPWYTDFVTTQAGGVDPLSMITEYNLIADIHSTLTFAPLNVEFEGESFALKGGTMEFTCDWLLENFSSSGTWAGADLGESMTMGEVTFESKMHLISTFIWDGVVTAEISKISGREEGVELEVEGVHVDYAVDYDAQKKVLAIKASYGVDRFSDGSEELSNAGITIGLRGVDAVAFEEVMKTVTELFAEVLDDAQAAGDDPEAMARAMEQKMTSVGLQMAGMSEKFLKSGLEIYIDDLRAELKEGKIGGNALIRLEKEMTMAQMFPLVQQPDLVFDFLSFSSNLRLPGVLIGENPMFLEPAYPGMKTGVFVRDGEDVVSKIETREKKLYINGEEFVLTF